MKCWLIILVPAIIAVAAGFVFLLYEHKKTAYYDERVIHKRLKKYNRWIKRFAGANVRSRIIAFVPADATLAYSECVVHNITVAMNFYSHYASIQSKRKSKTKKIPLRELLNDAPVFPPLYDLSNVQPHEEHSLRKDIITFGLSRQRISAPSSKFKQVFGTYPIYCVKDTLLQSYKEFVVLYHKNLKIEMAQNTTILLKLSRCRQDYVQVSHRYSLGNTKYVYGYDYEKKDGTPDMRYKNNRQYIFVLFSYYRFTMLINEARYETVLDESGISQNERIAGIIDIVAALPNYEQFDSLAQAYREYSRWKDHVSQKVTDKLSDIDKMSGQQFEQFCARLYELSHGAKCDLTPGSNDYGADIIVTTPQGEKIAVQTKRYENSVGVKAINEVVGSKQFYKVQQLCVITNSNFTPQAQRLAFANDVQLVDRDSLIKWMADINKKAEIQC